MTRARLRCDPPAVGRCRLRLCELLSGDLNNPVQMGPFPIECLGHDLGVLNRRGEQRRTRRLEHSLLAN